MSTPKSIHRLMVTELSTNFRQCTKLCEAPFPSKIRGTQLIVKHAYAGVNASDINFSAGAYKPGVQPPFECGFEAVGRVVQVGEQVKNLAVGDAVVTQAYGAFADYQVVSHRNARKIPSVDPKYLPLEISGTTAALALENQARPKQGETALVTAAAGGTGLFAAQLLKKKYGCHVIATCSSTEKVELLKSLGIDRVVNYKSEDLQTVLEKEYPAGINVIYESVGGKLLQTALQNISVKGRLVTIGSITGYSDQSSFGGNGGNPKLAVPISTHLLQRSATMAGFFLPHYGKQVPRAFNELAELVDNGTIRSVIDPRRFVGVESCVDAVEYLHTGKNAGKVVVELDASLAAKSSSKL